MRICIYKLNEDSLLQQMRTICGNTIYDEYYLYAGILYVYINKLF